MQIGQFAFKPDDWDMGEILLTVIGIPRLVFMHIMGTYWFFFGPWHPWSSQHYWLAVVTLSSIAGFAYWLEKTYPTQSVARWVRSIFWLLALYAAMFYFPSSGIGGLK